MELDKFYGRHSVMELLKRRVLDLKEGYRHNVAFLGERYIGKSSILQKFFSDLDDHDIIVVYLDMENKDFSCFVHNFIRSLLYNFAKTKDLPLQDDIKILMETNQGYLPQTVKASKKILDRLSQGKTAEAYREVLNLPQVFVREANKFCILILDEFHNLEELAIPGVFQELGNKIMMQKRCLYIVSSSLPGVAKKILSEKLSLLFGNFEDVAIEPFDLKTSQEFVGFHLGDTKIGEEIRNFLIDFTGGHPLYLQLLCQELLHLKVLHKQDEVFVPLLTLAIENILFNPWGVLSRHFDLVMSRICSGKGNLVMAPLLIALSKRKQKIKELALETGVREHGIKQRIARLMEMGIVVKNGNFYYLKDKLLKYWTKYVFEKRQRAIEMDPARQREEFRIEITRAVDSFKINAKKDMSSRIIELLACFEEESLQINGRRYKLPFFQEISPKKVRRFTEGQFEMIKASTSEGEWFIVFKTASICENDINSILQETKRSVQKPLRCILISLADLDENARVRALQERMWIWNEGELNTLLSLYDKPYIMH